MFTKSLAFELKIIKISLQIMFSGLLLLVFTLNGKYKYRLMSKNIGFKHMLKNPKLKQCIS